MSFLKFHTTFVSVYLVEMAFILMVYLFLNIHNVPGDRNHVLLFLAVVLTQYIFSHLINIKFQLKFIYILVPVTFIILMFTGDYFLSALLISALPVWRLEQLHYSLSDTLAPLAILASLIWLIIISVLSTAEVDANFSTFNLIFVLAIMGYIISKIVSLAMDSGFGLPSYLKVISVFTAIFLSVSFFTGYVYKFVIFGLSYLVIFLLNAFVFLLRPLFGFLENIELEYPDEPFEEEESNLDGYESPEEIVSATNQILNIPYGPIILAIAFIAIILFICSYFKNRDVVTDNKVSHQKHTFADKNSTYKKINKKAPADKGRKLYFDFEKWASSKGYGRYEDETIEQWFNRMSLDDHISISKLQYYQKMRYKDKVLSEEEFKLLEIYIKEFKDILNKKPD